MKFKHPVIMTKTLLLCGLFHIFPAHAENSHDPLPPVDMSSKTLSALPTMRIKAFKLEGASLFKEALEAIAAEYSGREISAEELQELRNKLSRYYIDRGYINSGAIIPDQEIIDGTVRLEITEGVLNEIQISGNKHLNTAYLRGRIHPDPKEILNTGKLQERLQILQQGPVLQRFNAELGPGLKLGEAVLKLDMMEKRPYEFGVEFNNHRSPNIGSYRLILDARHHSLSGRGDSLYARYGLTKGLKDYALSYDLPLNAKDTTFKLQAENSDSEVVSEPFDKLNVGSESSTYSIGFSHPLFKTYTTDFHYKLFELGVSLEKRKSETFLLDQPFSFSNGVQEGVSKLTVLRLSQNWLDRSRNRVLAAYSSFGFGLNALGATVNDGLDPDGNPLLEPDGRFVTWSGQFRWIERIPKFLNLENSRIWLRANLQWANKDLLPLEKMALGGSATVRGYRENQLTRDRGVVLSAEWQVPMDKEGIWMLAPFLDYGTGWNVKLDTPAPKSIYSIGLGILWQPKETIQAELYWGKALRDVVEPEDDDIQDEGIHFSARMGF